jgi:hypothetical protein
MELSGDRVKLDTTRREFTLDVSHVDDLELRRMRKVLQKMNFDKAITLKVI